MESSRDRTCRATRKITSPERRCEDIFTSLTNQRECTMPRRSAKQPKTIKTNESNKHFVYQNKSYLIKKASHGKVPALLPNDTSCGSPKNSALMSKFNRTAFGSPIDKSAMYSYIATPNERSTPNLLHRVTTRK